MSKKNIKETVSKTKELIDNIDDQEKELIKAGVKETVDAVKEIIEEKKTTGSVSKASILSVIALIVSLLGTTYNAVTTPDITALQDSLAITNEIIVEQANTIASIDSVKVNTEDLSKMIKIENGVIVIGSNE